MTRKEAIKLLDKWGVLLPSDADEALDMAIEALQTKTDGDLIKRDDAIEAVTAEGRNVHTSEYANAERIIHEADAVEALSMLPSADAVEVVRCKDCKWWNSETNGCKRNPSVEAWHETDFCSYGERRKDETV